MKNSDYFRSEINLKTTPTHTKEKRKSQGSINNFDEIRVTFLIKQEYTQKYFQCNENMFVHFILYSYSLQETSE